MSLESQEDKKMIRRSGGSSNHCANKKNVRMYNQEMNQTLCALLDGEIVLALFRCPSNSLQIFLRRAEQLEVPKDLESR